MSNMRWHLHEMTLLQNGSSKLKAFTQKMIALA